jgi:AcrR family transcriptional regulator
MSLNAVNPRVLRSCGTDVGAVQSQSPRDVGREEILDAAAAAFLERGYVATSIDDIADRLGSTKGRIYHHFPTKGSVFLDVYHRAFRAAIDAVAPIARSRGPAADRLYRMAQVHTRLTLGAGQVGPSVRDTELALVSEGGASDAKLRAITALRKQYEDCFTAVIEQGVKSGEVRPVNPALMVKATLGALNCAAALPSPAANDQDAAETVRIADAIAAFVTQGVARRDGAAGRAAGELIEPLVAAG